MRHLLLAGLGIAALLGGCSPHEEGPMPVGQSVAPNVVCNDQLETWMELTGAGLTPSVVDALTDNPGAALPELWITRTSALDGTGASDAAVMLNDDPTDKTNTRVKWTSQAKMSFLVDESLALGEGVYDIGVRNPTGKESVLSEAFAVVAPPVLMSAVPTPVCTAQYANEITVTGERFLILDSILPTVTIGGVDFAPTSADGCVAVAEAVRPLQQCTTLKLTIEIDDVGVGDHDVVVTNPEPAHCASSEPVKLRVLPPPTVTSIDPQPVCVSQADRQLTIEGADFLVLAGALPEVTVGGVQIAVDEASGCAAIAGLTDAEACTTLSVTVAQGLIDPGVHDVIVTNPTSAQCVSEEPVTLTVVPPPVLVSVEPQPICNEQSEREVVLTGTGFLVIDGVLPSVTLGTYTAVDVAATAATCAEVEGVTGVESCTELVVTLPTGTLPAGAHDVQVTNPAPAGCETTEALSLTVVPPPSIASLEPSTVCLDEADMSVLITGTGFLVVGEDEPSVTVDGAAPLSAAITEASCTPLAGFDDVLTCTDIVIELAQSSLAPEDGPFDVVVTNPQPAGCASTEAMPLTVVHAPEVTDVSPTDICTGGGILTVTGQYLEGISAYLEDSVGAVVLPTNVTVTDGGATATLAFAAGLKADTYDLHIEGLGGCGEVLSAAIAVSLGPVAYFFDPKVVYGGVATRGTLYASGITILPGSVTLVPSGGGDEIELLDVAWSALTPNKVQATVPAGLAAGVYDLFLRDVDGCDAILGNAVTVVTEPTLALLDPALSPPFGEQGQDVAVSVLAKADADLVDDEVNFAATPRVYLSSPSLSVAEPLRAVVWESSSRLSAVVPPLAEGTYDLVVVNPDGTVGFEEGAYQATAVAPPEIDTVQPSKIEGDPGQELVINGRNFADAAVTVTCSDGSAPTAVIDVASATSLEVTLDASAAGHGAACIVRITNTANQTFDDWSALSVTNPSGNMSAFELGQPLSVGRRAPAVAVAQVTREARYLYVVGGDNGAEASAMTSVEAASLDAFGETGTFRTLSTELPAGRTLASARPLGDFLYVVGGALADGSASDDILRAEVLDPLDAPLVTNVDLRFAANSAGLAAGSWTYVVAAVFDGLDERNPSGEGLPSEPVTLYAPDVPDGVEVELTWATVLGADDATPAVAYRVYRTLAVNGGGADLRLLAEVTPVVGATQSFLDENQPTFEDDAKRPLAVGDLGQWHVIDTLNTPRASYGFTVNEQTGCTPLWYVFGGQTDVSTESLTYEVIDVSSDELGAISEFTAAGTISARRRHAVWTADAESSTASLTACHFYFYVGPGQSGASTAESTVRVATYTGAANGELGSFVNAMNTGSAVTWYGYAAFHSGAFAYSLGGTRGGTVADDVEDGEFSTPPTLSNWNDSGGLGTLAQARTLYGFTRFGAFNYLVGGVGGTGTALTSTELNVR